MEVHLAALDSWSLVAEISCIWTLARRTVADEVVHKALQCALSNAVQEMTMSSVGSQKETKTSGSSKSQKAKIRRKSGPSAASAHAQFFLTEFESGDQQASDDDSDCEESVVARRDKHPQRRHVAPALRNKVAVARDSQVSDVADPTPPIRVRKVFDLSDQKTQRIAAIHKSRIEAMEAERLRRVGLVEQVQSLTWFAPNCY